MGRISATDLRTQLLARAGEIALLDVREESRYGAGHLMAASSAPFSGLEMAVPRLVPRRATPVVLCSDAQDGLAERARQVLLGLGYDHVMVLDGGRAACETAGLGIFSGLNTPSKVLAAFVQTELEIPDISPEALAAKLNTGDPVQVLDCRPSVEYGKGTIPGAINCPGGDLARYEAQPPHRSCTHVITCAGRSRGLTSAQLLREQKFTGEVFALERGTMGWELSGRQLESGAERTAPIMPAGQATAQMLETALCIREQHQISSINSDELESLLANRARTTVLFDIRSRPEYEARHIAGARHVAGGQLIHNIDMHMATRGSRLVLCDDDGVRATSIALWLKRMGWDEVFVATMSDCSHETEAGPPTPGALDRQPDVKLISPADLKDVLRHGKTAVIDVANSRQYRKGHIAGAWFCKRVQMTAALERLSNCRTVVVTSEDGVLAGYAAHEHSGGSSDLRVLEGGTAAWLKEGYDLARDMERLVHEPDDAYLKPSEIPQGAARAQAMHQYLEGTQELLSKALGDGSLPLRALPVEHEVSVKMESTEAAL